MKVTPGIKYKITGTDNLREISRITGVSLREVLPDGELGPEIIKGGRVTGWFEKPMKDLILHVTGEYFDHIKSGEKTEEYRLCNDYWDKRLSKTYDRIIIQKGYPKRGDTDRTLIFPWASWMQKTITHRHFGNEPVLVYAIRLHAPHS